MNIQNKKFTILFIVIYITSYQATAEESGQPIILETNVYSLINKDIISHVDMDRLDIGGTPHLRFFWSPDERKVLIYAYINAYSKGKPDYGGVGALYLVDISQINSPKLIKWGEDTKNNIDDDLRSAISDIQWSPSGKFFSYLERSGGTFKRNLNEKWILQIINTSNLDVVYKKDVSPETIGGYLKDFSPETIGVNFQQGYSWSPVEDKIAYIGFDESESRDIFIWDLPENSFYETGIKEQIKNFDKTDLTWSQDGRKLALANHTFGDVNESLLIIDIINKKIINLFSAPEIGVYKKAFWSPDSKNILISESYPNEKFQVYLVNMENGESKMLTTFSGGSVIKWSMDGKKILFTTPKLKNGDIYQVYSMGVDGSSPPVLFFENNLSPPESTEVSGNFTILTFIGESYNVKKLIVLENENKKLTEVNNVSNYNINLKSDRIFYVIQNDEQNNSLFTISPIAGNKQISILHGDILSFSPSGNSLIIETRSESIEKENNKEKNNMTNSSIQEANISKSPPVQAPWPALIFLGVLIFVVHYVIKIRRFL